MDSLHCYHGTGLAMSALVARFRLRLAEALHVSEQDNENTGWGFRFGNISEQLVAVGTIALIGTCIRVWAGMDVIQTQINTLVKSDNQQDERIENVRSEVNNLRVQVGILRAQLGSSGLGRP